MILIIHLLVFLCIQISSQYPLQMELNYDEEITDNIFIRIYEKRQFIEYPYNEGLQLLNSQFYNPSKPSFFYCHGWTESTNSTSTRTVVSSYIENGEWNIIAFDYSRLVHAYENYTGMRQFMPAEIQMLNYVSKIYTMEGMALSYFDSVKNSTKIGSAIGDLMVKYVENGLPVKKIHLVGHSLGGQIISFIAKTFKKSFNDDIRLPRITALDPAGPIFVLKSMPKIDEEDADMVDVMHTDPNFFGYPTDLGDVDFYPNIHLLMTIQPGCRSARSAEGCSHYRSWEYYSESVVNPTAFPSVRCINKYAFLFNYCDNNSLTFMGYLYPSKGDGEFYLETGSSPPFGMEMDGIPEQPVETYDFNEIF